MTKLEKEIEKIHVEVMKKLEKRPYNKDKEWDENYNYIHQSYVGHGMARIRALVKADIKKRRNKTRRVKK